MSDLPMNDAIRLELPHLFDFDGIGASWLAPSHGMPNGAVILKASDKAA